MSRGFIAVLAVLAIAFAVITGLAVQRGILSPHPQQTATLGGPFQLVDQTGRPRDQHILEGKWTAVFFGYTNCPDACPTTLFALGQTEKLLGAKAADFQTIFISVDPARDTPAQLARYLSNDAFARHVTGLTGSQAQVDVAAKAYKVFAQKAGEGPDYTVNHSTFTYLMNPKGGFACVIPYNAPPQQIASQVQKAMAQGPNAESC
ncbi:SCO family protein [Phenylobacterium soli]|uniref:SCO family protein n=1 Tax=Phenylobacterium soli TaxID=2170551 RepID=A0A328AIV4_9CAUL|nr:SCO family protein [Phenylobacterium soli]RAK53344.1 SCO family protein [Phenylobacterium soli]